MAQSPLPGRLLLELFFAPAASKNTDSTACPIASVQVLYKLNTVTFSRFQKTQPHVQSQEAPSLKLCHPIFDSFDYLIKRLLCAFSTFGEGRKEQKEEKKDEAQKEEKEGWVIWIQDVKHLIKEKD